jgi:hypothetical protein
MPSSRSLYSIAATLLMAANLPRYISAVPQPVPEADSVRYKVGTMVLSPSLPYFFPFSPPSQMLKPRLLFFLCALRQLCYNEDTKKMEFQRRECG